MTRFPDALRSPALRRAGVWALILCTTCLAIENTLLLSWAATSRPWALLAAASAAFKAIFALSVPLGLVLAAAIAAWCLPFDGEREARSRRNAILNGGQDD